MSKEYEPEAFVRDLPGGGIEIKYVNSADQRFNGDIADAMTPDESLPQAELPYKFESVRLEPAEHKSRRQIRREEKNLDRPYKPRRFNKLRNALRVTEVCVVAAGILAIGSQLDFEIDLFPGDKTEMGGKMAVDEVTVETYQATVLGGIHAEESIKLYRNLSHVWPIPDCNLLIDESKVPFDADLEVADNKMTVTKTKSGYNAVISEFKEPELRMPTRFMLNTDGGDPGICIKKSGEEKTDSPENVIESIARRMLDASNTRIVECVLNKANDPGSSVSKALIDSIKKSVADKKGVEPEKITVSIENEDTDIGIKAINDEIKVIEKEQKDLSEFKIETQKVKKCDTHNLRVELSDD